MKKFLFSLIFLLVSYVGFSQKGLSYQAVILDPNKIEVPGQDISGQPLVNGDVWLKFSIYNGSILQFEEVHKTKTDNYGLVNLLIGSVSSASFNSLVWDSSQKSLYVYASFDQGGSYTKISEQKLTYNPYALFAETAGKLGGVLGIAGGGTGATTVSDARLNLGLDQVNNTSDAAKPVSTATQAALDLKANASDVTSSLALKANTADMTAALAAKADTGTIKAYVDTKIGSNNNTSNQSSSSNVSSAALAAKADTSYVLAQVAAATIADADATTKGKIQLAGDLAGTAAAPAVPGLALKANVTDLVTLTSTVNSNTASITSNSTAIISEATTARAAELVLTNRVAANTASITSNATNLAGLTTTVVANTASITANTNAITLKAPIASPVFTGTVAIGTANPSAGAVLDITSTSKGLLLPRLTFAQKSAIVSPEAGLILWCSDCGTNGELQVYNGTNFVNMVGANAQFALPSVTSTASATSITSSALTSGGVIDADGGAFVTARGVVWNTSTNPTISLSTKTTDGSGIGTFSSAITGLTSGVTYYVRAYATNSVGTKYGPEISVNTAQAVATLASTTSASSIGATTATSGGNITYNGGATVTVSGLVWSTSANPTTSDSKTTDGTTNGIFTSNITGLTPGTLYYVRSYATNSVGTSYGAQTSFTTLNTASISATTSATSITSTSATSGGTITTDGGAAVSARGIVWGTSTGSSTISVTTGSGTGTFVSNLTGLSPATTYYVRSFATNSVGTVYGTETSFTTIAVEPTVQATVLIASITGSSATSGGTITSNGGATVTTSGVVWSTTSTPTIALSTKTTNGAAIGTYTSSLTGLAPATLYYVRAYATNSIGTAYGPERSFTTLAIAPTISGTSSATSITSSTATAGGTITTDGGASVTSRGLVYGTSSGASTFSVTTGTGAGTYTSSLTGLSPATTYFVRSFATNSVGTVYGTETSFTTIAIAPTLTTTAASSITKYAASAGGTITSNGGSAITASGICWSTTATPTTANSKTTDGTTSGTFTSSITGLTAGTVYYVRAYATNAIGTSYGAAQSFTTLSTPVAQTSVLIGTQRWTDKNLNVANYRNGDAITYAANSAQWAAATSAGEGAYTYLKYASGDGGATYGKLYNWYAVNDARGLAPAGYHIPTLSEWTTLRSSQNLNGTTLKSNTTDWSGEFSNVNNNISVTPNANYNLYNGTNSTGFNVLPGGSIFNTGTNGNYGSASFWTATQDATNPTRAEWLYFHPSFFYVGSDCCATENKQTGMSIRLVKDNNLVESSPTTPILASTTSATSITANSAILGGNVTDEGATQVSVRGLVYGTSTGSSTYSVTVGSGAGTFTSTLTGLTQGATYYVRSFATNVQGTSYGAETSFTTQTTPTLSATTAASSIGTTTATSGGTITYNGGATITTSGLVWGATANPEITLATKTTNGATSGTFTSTITGLTQGTTYHVRAYATNYLGTSYGPDITFTTLTTPTVSATATISSITGTTATGGGTITADGGASVTSRGVVYGTSSGSSTYSSTSGTGTGAYVSSLTGLIPVTTYYVRAFATNSVGTVYGTETSFTTSAGPASNAMITTEPSGAAAGIAFATQPVVRITDTSGNTVTTSTFNVVASIASGSGTLGGTTTVAAVNGVATFTNLVLSGATGNFTLAFTPTSLTAATSNSFALSFGTASKAMITTQPSGAVNGVALTTQPVIRVTDASGNTVTSSTVNVVASIGSGTGTLGGTTTVAAVNGVATFTDLVLSGTAGNFTLTFTPTSLTAATSNSFALSFGAASQAMISTQPSGAFNGIEFSTQPVVKITDAGGNTITSSTANVVASIASGSGTLGGTTAVNAVAGVANFTNLKITGTGNHTLTFTPAGGLTAATSNTLNVAQLGCAQGGTCAIGETGPGGGTVFYYSAAGFNCGASFTSTGSPTGGQCHYLEYAPAGWNGPQADPYAYWSPNTTTSVGATSTAIGSGYKNSELMRVNDGTLYHPDGRPYAGAYIRSKTLGGKSDWYLPSKDELNQLCKWARGLPATTPDIEADGTAGTLSSINNPSTGWVQDHYWSSSENAPSKAYSKDFRGNTVYLGKIWNFVIRPIRAF